MAKTTKTTSFTDHSTLNLSKGQLAPPKHNEIRDTKLPGTIASRSQTVNSIRGNLDHTAINHLADLANSGLQDNINVADLGAQPETLPAIISTAISDSKFNPRWHMVKNLPGYIASAIRALGRQVFAPITSTPIEKIQVLSTLSNSDYELKVVGTWIKRNGIRSDSLSYHFERLMPGYNAEIDVYHCAGFTFVIVVDFMGKYIYGWPADHDKLT